MTKLAESDFTYVIHAGYQRHNAGFDRIRRFAIEPLLHQSFSDFEMIIQDDCSKVPGF
ncbi:MAG: hypothetical protein ACLQJ7_05645 [Syntrophobacteraceae bacterium]